MKVVIWLLNLTRDGWFNQGTEVTSKTLTSGKTEITTTTHLVNRSSEPVTAADGENLKATATNDYGPDAGAYALSTFNAEATPPSWDTYTDGSPVDSEVKRANPGKAKSVMIHVGGIFLIIMEIIL